MLIGIHGSLGSGKTLLLTFLLARLKVKGYQIWTNFQCSFADVVKSAEELILDLEERQQMPNYRDIKIALGLDELGRILKAIGFMTTSNELLDNIIVMSRKLNTDILYTSQHRMMVDRQVRRITDVLIQTAYNDKTTKVTSEVWTREGLTWEISEFTIDGSKMFEHYDTYELVLPDKEAIVKKLFVKAKRNKELMKKLREQTKKPDKIELLKYFLEISVPMAKVLLTYLKV
jgi:hypothetical protein